MVFKIPFLFLIFLVVNSQALNSEQTPTELLNLDTLQRIVPEFETPISSTEIESDDETLLSDSYQDGDSSEVDIDDSEITTLPVSEEEEEIASDPDEAISESEITTLPVSEGEEEIVSDPDEAISESEILVLPLTEPEVLPIYEEVDSVSNLDELVITDYSSSETVIIDDTGFLPAEEESISEPEIADETGYLPYDYGEPMPVEYEPEIADETGYYNPDVNEPEIYTLSDPLDNPPTEEEVKEKADEVKEVIEDFVRGFLDEDGECGCVDEENCLETVEVLIDCVDGECTATLVTETDIDFDAKLKLTAIPDPLLNGECCG